MSLKSQLMDMGFLETRVNKALAAVKQNQSLESAMDWMISHEGDPDIDAPMEETSVPAAALPADDVAMTETPSASSAEAVPETPAQAQSIKCNDCGKVFKTEEEVHFHAVKSGHANFEESTEVVKPLTEQEKRDRLDALQERLKLRRVQHDDDERKKNIEMEKQRRAQGQDLAMAKIRLEQEEMKQIAAERKKQKHDDKILKQKLLDQIKADRDDMKRERELSNQSNAGGAATVASKPTLVEPPPKRDYDQCKLQIRLRNGSAIVQTFAANELLAAVRLFVQINGGGGDEEPFSLMTSFPKKVFSEEDMQTPLSELGLVPSAVVIVTKQQ